MSSRLGRSLAAISLTALMIAPAVASAQVYSGTNGKLVYLNATGDLLSANPDGTFVTTLATAAALGGTPGSLVAVNKAQNKIAYVPASGTGLVTANIDGTGQQTASSTSGDINPVWSPDGTKLYFQTAANDIDSVNPDGTGRTTVLTHTGSVTYSDPSVSPDGTKLAVSSFDTGTSRQDILVSPSTGGATTNITNTGAGVGATQPDWSPDGSTIVYTNLEQTVSSRISTVPATGGSSTTVVAVGSGNSGDPYYFWPHYSPSGTQIAFQVATIGAGGGGGYGTFPLHLINPNGTGETTVSALGNIGFSYWSGIVLGAAAAATPGLPNAGQLAVSLPVALGVIGLLAAAGIETARRVRRRA